MIGKIAKIKSTFLGIEDHGLLTAWLTLDGGGWGQGAGGYTLDGKPEEGSHDRVPHAACGAFVAGVLRACGVRSWEEVAGRTVYAYYSDESLHSLVIGIGPLPTESGMTFMFEDLKELHNG